SLVWNLPGFRNGRTVGGIRHRGSERAGFRGLASDKAGNLYLTNRTDNSLYHIPSATMQQQAEVEESGGRTIKKNAIVYKENKQTHRIGITFDSDPTDLEFPKLGDIVIDCPN